MKWIEREGLLGSLPDTRNAPRVLKHSKTTNYYHKLQFWVFLKHFKDLLGPLGSLQSQKIERNH